MSTRQMHAEIESLVWDGKVLKVKRDGAWRDEPISYINKIMPQTDFDEWLDALFAGECTQCDDHDPPPCPKCERMKAAIREKRS